MVIERFKLYIIHELIFSMNSQESYNKLYKKIKPLFDLQTVVKTKDSEKWFFDHEPGAKEITIHTPEFSEKNTPVFVHYLGHAKLLESGWPRFKGLTKVTSEDLKSYFDDVSEEEERKRRRYWMSRSEDSFFDFFVWRFVQKKSGEDWLKKFVEKIAVLDSQSIIAHFGPEKKSAGVDVFRFLYSIDWYGALYTLCKIHGFDKQVDDLNKQWAEIESHDMYTKVFKKKLPNTIDWLRDFYLKINQDYPTFQDFLKDKDRFDSTIKEYYKNLWKDTGFEAELLPWETKNSA